VIHQKVFSEVYIAYEKKPKFSPKYGL